MRTSVAWVWLVAGGAGLTSLGMETVWIRVASFARGNTPQTFGLVLGLFLVGIVIGAMWGKWVTQGAAHEQQLKANAAYLLLLTGLMDALSPIFVAECGETIWTFPLMALLIIFSAASKAIVFPIVHHLGSLACSSDTGRTVSRVYFSNIAGATVAPMIVGFWTLDVIGAEKTMFLLGGLSIALAAVFLPYSASKRGVVAAAGFVLVLWCLVVPQRLGMLDALIQGAESHVPAWIFENRYGVVHTVADVERGEIVFGGNVYDGRLSADLVRNGNGIDRVYWLAALHSTPRRVLVVGLSGGAWTEVLRHLPGAERIDVVEINPAYLELVRARAPYREMLDDPRLSFHIDDGRRWLRQHGELRYDLIVMNTTFHWRAYITNLLSKEFVAQLKTHLEPSGVLAYNSTGSPDVLATAASVFAHAYRWSGSNFVYASERDFREIDQGESRSRLLALTRAVPAMRGYSDREIEGVVGTMLSRGWIDTAKEARLSGRELEIITDANMLTEYKFGRSAL